MFMEICRAEEEAISCRGYTNSVLSFRVHKQLKRTNNPLNISFVTAACFLFPTDSQHWLVFTMTE